MRPQPQNHQPRSVAKPISSLFSPQQTLNTKQTPSTEPVPPSLPQSHTKKFEHIRTSSFSATPPRLDSHPFKPPSFIGSNRPSNHRRHTSFNRYDVPETSSSMRYPK